jgi:hypothetical protein
MESTGRRFVPFDKYSCRAEAYEPDVRENQLAGFNIRYVNACSRAISVKSRMGVNSIIAPKQYTKGGEYIDVYLEWRMSKDSFKATYLDFLDRHHNPTGLASEIICAFRDRVNSYSHGALVSSLSIHIEIHLNDIVDAGGTIYMEDMDITICLEPERQKYEEHPFSQFNRMKYGIAADLPHVSDNTLLFSIKAVDNSLLRNRHDRFMMMGNVVHHIPIERDTSLKDGIHVTTRRPALVKNASGEGTYLHTEYLTFEEADIKYNLADSIEKAQAGVSWNEIRKEELNKILHDRKLEELNRATDKADKEHINYKERVEWERSQQQHKDRAAESRQREEVTKDHTRNFGDWIRLISGIVASSFTLITMVAKMKPS